MLKNIRIITVSLILFSIKIHAMTGIELLNNCQNVINDVPLDHNGFFKAGECIGFLTAIDHYDSQKTFCTPLNMTNEQAAKTVVNYIENYPKQINLAPVSIVELAFKKNFPCQT